MAQKDTKAALGGFKQATPSSLKSRDKFEAPFDHGKKALTKKEQEELRRKQEEEEAKAVLQDFVATFDSNGKGGPKMFVKGDTINPLASEDKADKLYKPALKLLAKPGGGSGKLSSSFSEESTSTETERQAKKRTEEKKKSNLELFKEELKRMQMEREERHRKRQVNLKDEDSARPDKSAFDNDSSQESNTASFVSSGPGKQPHSVDDPTTTNIFISNLSPKTVEQDLIKRFGKYGLLGSVKIMWPRSEEEKARSANCGFVAFMQRRDAEIAIKELDGSTENGTLMRLSWSKAVAIPAQPIYIPPELVEVIIPPPPSGLPFNAQPQSAEQMRKIKKKAKQLLGKYKKGRRSKRSRKKGRRSRSDSTSDSDSSASSIFSSSSSGSSSRSSSSSSSTSSSSSPRSSSSDREKSLKKSSDFNKTLQNAVVKVVIPTERTLLCLIHKTVEFVAKYGPEFEAALIAREASNPLYRFMIDYQSPSHGYYRWKLYSVLHGESVYRWNTLPFQMFAGGSYWQPPPLNRFTRGCDDDESYKRVKRELVAKMGNKLANDKRDSLNELVSGLTIERKSIADAMVFCIDNAEKSEQIIESLIEAIVPGTDTPLNKIVARFYLLSDILHNCCAKVANASNYRRSIEHHLVSVFENANKIWNSIDGKLKSESFKQRILSCVRAWEDWAIYPNEFLVRLQNTFLGLTSTSTTDPAKRKDDNDNNGHSRHAQKPIVDDDEEDEDVDGKPLEENEMETTASLSLASKKEASSKFVSSKWETVDPDNLERQAITTSKWDFDDEQQDQQSTLKNLTSYEDDEEEEEERTCQDASKTSDDDQDDEDIDGKPLDDDDDSNDERSNSSSRSPHSKYMPNNRHDSSNSKKTKYL